MPVLKLTVKTGKKRTRPTMPTTSSTWPGRSRGPATATACPGGAFPLLEGTLDAPERQDAVAGTGRCQLRIVQHRGRAAFAGCNALWSQEDAPASWVVELVPQRGQRRADRGEEQGPRSLLGVERHPGDRRSSEVTGDDLDRVLGIKEPSHGRPARPGSVPGVGGPRTAAARPG